LVRGYKAMWIIVARPNGFIRAGIALLYNNRFLNVPGLLPFYLRDNIVKSPPLYKIFYTVRHDSNPTIKTNGIIFHFNTKVGHPKRVAHLGIFYTPQISGVSHPYWGDPPRKFRCSLYVKEHTTIRTKGLLQE
jgi:hypothetical protein